MVQASKAMNEKKMQPPAWFAFFMVRYKHQTDIHRITEHLHIGK
jgi:hypothetical protein